MPTSQSPKTTGGRLPIGAVLSGRYKITGFLGSGGFAVVYEGFDDLIERPVAIKVLKPFHGIDDPDERASLLERFRREAKAAAKIVHSNIVTIHDMGVTEDEQPFIVMERLVGIDLDEMLKENGGLEPVRALRLFCQALEALAEAHRQQIVHRDLKPANIFLTRPGTPQEEIRLLDFGIARMESWQGNLTGTGQVIGTAGYLAPEYILHRLVTPALDVYQMGLILVEMLTGHPVVSGDNPLACISHHTQGNIYLPEVLLSGPLGPVMIRALILNPEERFEDAQAFRDALEGIDASEIQAPRQEGALHRLADISASINAVTLPPPIAPIASTAPHQVSSTDLSVAQRVPVRVGSEKQGSTAPLTDVSETPGSPPLREIAKTTQFSREEAHATDDSPTPTPSVDGVTPPAPSRSGLKWGITAVGGLMWLAATILLAGIAFTFLVDDASEPSPTPSALVSDKNPTPPQSATEPPPQDLSKPPKSPVEEAPDKLLADNEPETKAEAPQPPTSFEVEIITEPAGATVFEGKKKLGKAPVVISFDSKDAAPVQISTRRRGYKSITQDIAPSDSPSMTVRLERAKSTKPASSKKPPGKKPEKNRWIMD